MGDAPVVRGDQCLDQGESNLHEVLECHPTGRDYLVQPLSRNQLHGQEVHPLGFFDREDSDDPRVTQRGDGLGLPLEAPQPLGVPSHAFRQHLERHLAF